MTLSKKIKYYNMAALWPGMPDITDQLTWLRDHDFDIGLGSWNGMTAFLLPEAVANDYNYSLEILNDLGFRVGIGACANMVYLIPYQQYYAWGHDSPTPATTVSLFADRLQNVVNVTSAAGFSPTDQIGIGHGRWNYELHTIQSIDGNEITLVANFAYPHAIGEAISPPKTWTYGGYITTLLDPNEEYVGPVIDITEITSTAQQPTQPPNYFDFYRPDFLGVRPVEVTATADVAGRVDIWHSEWPNMAAPNLIASEPVPANTTTVVTTTPTKRYCQVHYYNGAAAQTSFILWQTVPLPGYPFVEATGLTAGQYDFLFGDGIAYLEDTWGYPGGTSGDCLFSVGYEAGTDGFAAWLRSVTDLWIGCGINQGNYQTYQTRILNGWIDIAAIEIWGMCDIFSYPTNCPHDAGVAARNLLGAAQWIRANAPEIALVYNTDWAIPLIRNQGIMRWWRMYRVYCTVTDYEDPAPTMSRYINRAGSFAQFMKSQLTADSTGGLNCWDGLSSEIEGVLPDEEDFMGLTQSGTPTVLTTAPLGGYGWFNSQMFDYNDSGQPADQQHTVYATAESDVGSRVNLFYIEESDSETMDPADTVGATTAYPNVITPLVCNLNKRYWWVRYANEIQSQTRFTLKYGYTGVLLSDTVPTAWDHDKAVFTHIDSLNLQTSNAEHITPLTSDCQIEYADWPTSGTVTNTGLTGAADDGALSGSVLWKSSSNATGVMIDTTDTITIPDSALHNPGEHTMEFVFGLNALPTSGHWAQLYNKNGYWIAINDTHDLYISRSGNNYTASKTWHTTNNYFNIGGAKHVQIAWDSRIIANAPVVKINNTTQVLTLDTPVGTVTAWDTGTDVATIGSHATSTNPLNGALLVFRYHTFAFCDYDMTLNYYADAWRYSFNNGSCQIEFEDWPTSGTTVINVGVAGTNYNGVITPD